MKYETQQYDQQLHNFSHLNHWRFVLAAVAFDETVDFDFFFFAICQQRLW